MTGRDAKKKLAGPWRTFHGLIWLIGIIILAAYNWWWPGILVLVAISALYEGILQLVAPRAFEEEKVIEQPMPPAEEIADESQAPNALPIAEHRIDLLPQVCPSCNAPIRGHEVKWTGSQSANCPYCGTNLPMNKA